jgi:NodT family efflux transporter outer membrane factor (OMF) lipoprotein
MKPIPLAALLMSLSMAGCITAPATTTLKPLDASELGLARTVAAPRAASAWWRGYDDPQLDRLMQQAIAANPTLAEALARVRAAQAVRDTTAAGLSPAVSFNAAESRQRFSDHDLAPPPVAGSVLWHGDAGLDLSWDLDFWGRQSSLVKQAGEQIQATRFDAAAARLAISGAVMRSYVELDRQFALADIAQRSVEQRTEILVITRKRVAAGLDTRIELREAEGAVPQAEVELRQAQLDQSLAVHRLAALSGAGAQTYAAIGRPQLNHDAALQLPATLPADLLGRRPDVLAARARVEAATAGKAAAKAAFYPDVNLTAFAGTAALGFGALFHAASGTYGAGPAIHLPLFDGGRLRADYRGASAGIDGTVAAYDRTVLDAVRETADQLSRIQALHEQLARQRLALDAAEDAYALARLRYQSGLASYLTVLNAESQVLAARRQHVDLAAAQSLARVALLLAAGGSFDPQAVPAVATR